MSSHKNIRLLTIFNLLLDFRPYAPIEILYFLQVTGSFATSLLIFSIATISACLAEVPTGLLSDMVGRRKTIILGSLCSTLGIALYAVGGSFWVLAAGAVFSGISKSFFSGNNDALLHDTLTQENQEHRYAEIVGKTSSILSASFRLVFRPYSHLFS